jgi:hypothetical protein
LRGMESLTIFQRYAVLEPDYILIHTAFATFQVLWVIHIASD